MQSLIISNFEFFMSFFYVFCFFSNHYNFSSKIKHKPQNHANMSPIAILQTISFLSAVQFTIITTYYVVSNYGIFTLYVYHPIFMCLTLLLALQGIRKAQSIHNSYAAIPTSRTSTPTPNSSHSEKPGNVREALTEQHGNLQFLCTVCIGLGYIIIYLNKEMNSRPHTTSIHGICGWIAFYFFLIQLIAGVVLYYRPDVIGGVTKARKLYRAHRASGYISFLGIWMTVFIAVWNGYIGGVRDGFMWVWMVVSLAVILLGAFAGIKWKLISFWRIK